MFNYVTQWQYELEMGRVFLASNLVRFFTIIYMHIFFVFVWESVGKLRHIDFVHYVGTCVEQGFFVKVIECMILHFTHELC